MIALQPWGWLYAKSTVFAFILSLCPTVTRIARRNFYRVFPEYGWFACWRMTFRYFEAFLDFLYEKAKMTRLGEKDILSHCRFENVEILERLAREHTFVLCFGAHMVNFEYLVSLPLHLHNIGMCHIYLSVPANEWSGRMLEERGRFGAVNIPSDNVLRHVVRLKRNMEERKDSKEGYVLGSLSDYDPKAGCHHAFPFLEHMLEVKTGVERIGQRLGMGYCYAHVSRPKRGYYHVTFRELKPHGDFAGSEYPYTAEFVRQLDMNIREQPEIWMQWGSCRF
ncbi:MAG: hypothetical protein J6Y00_07570 [Paludibacteraceae bacterium]|nr:hypothetical protein [Paludibacteraceae bacterium]